MHLKGGHVYFLFFLFLPNGKSEAKMTNTETETDIWLLTFCMYTYMVLRVQSEHMNIEQTVQLLLSFLTSELYRSVEMIPAFFLKLNASLLALHKILPST